MRRAPVLFVIALAACKPALDDDAARVDTPRVVAVRIEPPEARPSEVVQVRVLYTDGKASTEAAPSISFCVARKALAETTPIAAECLAYDESRVEIGAGLSASGRVPRDACRLFGPDPPLASAGQPAGRPADPDPTGGYYQPGLLRTSGAPDATFDVRIRCGLAGATQEQLAAYEARYRVNANPDIVELASLRGGAAEPIADELRLAPGETRRLRVAWPSCDGDAPCGGAERYVAFDPAARTILDRREAMRVTWLATSGRFASARTGRDEGDIATTTENDFTADADATVFVVLRDARGGAAFRTFVVRTAR